MWKKPNHSLSILHYLKSTLLISTVSCTSVVLAATLTLTLTNGAQLDLVKQGSQYAVANSSKAQSLGNFSQAMLTPSGDALYVLWQGGKVQILNFGKYERLWHALPEEQAFIDFLKSSKQTAFLAMLTIWKAEFLQNWWNLELWSNFMANNLGLGSADSSMQEILEKTSALVYFLADKWNTLSYYDDFDEAVLTYKEADGFMEMITDLAEIAQDKAEIAQDKAEIAQLDKSIAKHEAEIAQDKAEIAQLDKSIAKNKQSIAKNKQSIAKNKQSIAKNKAIINAYKKVMWVLELHK